MKISKDFDRCIRCCLPCLLFVTRDACATKTIKEKQNLVLNFARCQNWKSFTTPIYDFWVNSKRYYRWCGEVFLVSDLTYWFFLEILFIQNEVAQQYVQLCKVNSVKFSISMSERRRVCWWTELPIILIYTWVLF